MLLDIRCPNTRFYKTECDCLLAINSGLLWDVWLICLDFAQHHNLSSIKRERRIYLYCFTQAPTPRQVRYKEKVMEIRKRRDSGLTKEQKEKYMVMLFVDLCLYVNFASHQVQVSPLLEPVCTL